MAKKEFKLPPISPLIGSTSTVFRQTLEGNTIEPEFKTKKWISTAIMRIFTPFRWYEKNFVLPKARRSNPEEIVFIVGHWRGGTTFLHNLMCQAVNASYVTTYQTVFPNLMGTKWLFRPFIKTVMPDKRPSDNVRLNVDFPQEEEFALSGMDSHSYYRFMYFPNDYKKHYDESTALKRLTPDEQDHFKTSYRDLVHQAHYNIPGDLMIIKNPINTARIEFLHELYPNAKWIHIYRNPYTVFRSTLKFFTELLPTLWFEKVSPEFIKSFVVETYTKLYKDFDSALERHPEINMVELKFEDFEKDPIRKLEELYSQLGLEGFEDSREAFEQYVGSQKRYTKNKYQFPADLVKLVDANWGEYVKRWGYSVPD